MNPLDHATQHYVRYDDAVEQIEKDEQETFDKIVKVMSEGADLAREKYQRPIRIAHAKSHGALRGKLVVNTDLPEYLRQGIFSAPGKEYDVIVRLSDVPGELTDQSKISTPRGFAIKVLGVSSPEGTQDFLMANGKAFIAPGPKGFLQAFKPNAELAPHLSDTTKGVVSDIARVTNAALMHLGANVGQLDFFGHPHLHPLTEDYYSQAPFRFGEYICKFSVTPETAALRAEIGKTFDPKGENALRTDVENYFRSNPAEFSFGVQLATDLEKMPIENTSVEWPEDLSPFQPVARIVLPAQEAYAPDNAKFVEELSFSPAHTLAEHKPLGGLNRARLFVYPKMSGKRREELGVEAVEPVSNDPLRSNES